MEDGTHPQRARRTYSLFTSTHQCECVLVAQVMMVELYHLCPPERNHLQVSHVTPMLVTPAPSHFQSITARSTIWTARPSPLQPIPEQHLHEPLNQQTQAGRKTTRKNHSHILNMRVPETCASTLPQNDKAKMKFRKAVMNKKGEGQDEDLHTKQTIIEEAAEKEAHTTKVDGDKAVTQTPESVENT